MSDTEEMPATAGTRALPAWLQALRVWLLRDAAIREERERVQQRAPEMSQALHSARRSRELGDRVRRGDDPLGEGPSLDLTVELYRQSLYWYRRADERSDPRAPDAAPDLDARLQSILARGFVETSALTPAELAPDAALLHAELERLDAHLRAPELRLQALRRQRRRRLVLSLVLLLLLGFGVARLVRGPDLAEGRPWKSSSVYDTCTPSKHKCAGHYTDIFFHTKDDESPWLEIDLGEVRSVSQVEIQNRRDYGPERAVPLLIELSDDGKTYRTVSRRERVFQNLIARFPRQKARYVRLRAERRTYLHFEGVRVFR